MSGKKEKKNKYLSFLPKLFFSRVGSVVVYTFPLAQVLGNYAGPLAKHVPVVRKIFIYIPFLSKYRLFFYKNRLLSLAVSMCLYKLFLKRSYVYEQTIFNTTYFFKHHVLHCLIVMGVMSLPEVFILMYCSPRSTRAAMQLAVIMISGYFIIVIPFIINAILGKYNKIQPFSDAVLYLLGDSPEKDGPKLRDAYWLKPTRYGFIWDHKNNRKKEENKDDQNDDDDDIE